MDLTFLLEGKRLHFVGWVDVKETQHRLRFFLEEGRRKKAEGRRQKAEGRRFVVYLCENRYRFFLEEGTRQKEEDFSYLE